ncbi:NAD(+)/NADH kinase [Candidatus Woesearchaeota archaeon]|nr:NAD(+)/NADH kinase [Candidatus Woesearchaeota archaeon]
MILLQANNALVVYKKSSFELYLEKGDAELRAYLEENNTNVQQMKKEHEEQKRTLDTVIGVIEKNNINYDSIYRAHLRDITDQDLVVVVGGDGTFLEVGHYIRNKIPIIGVNSDIENSAGHHCMSDRFRFEEDIRKIKQGTLEPRELKRLELLLNEEPIKEYALNDILVAHKNPAATSRYEIRVNEKQEFQLSSGIIICSSSGSSAWMKSAGGQPMKLASDKIQYLVRDPIYNKISNPTLVNGFSDEIKIKSKMRQGKLYIDGQHLRYDFTLGDELKIRQGESLNAYVRGDSN